MDMTFDNEPVDYCICGAPVPDGDAWCRQCGAVLDAEECRYIEADEAYDLGREMEMEQRYG